MNDLEFHEVQMRYAPDCPRSGDGISVPGEAFLPDWSCGEWLHIRFVEGGVKSGYNVSHFATGTYVASAKDKSEALFFAKIVIERHGNILERIKMFPVLNEITWKD